MSPLQMICYGLTVVKNGVWNIPHSDVQYPLAHIHNSCGLFLMKTHFPFSKSNT